MFTPEMVDDFTHIFGMGDGHIETIRAYFPHSLEKTFVLREFIAKDEYDLNVPDPIENHAVRGELIDLRRLHIVVSVAAKRVDGLIVGEKKDEVGLFLRRERGRHREQEKNGGED